MSDITPSARPLVLCQRLHAILTTYRESPDRESIAGAQARLFQLFAECGDPRDWKWGVWPNFETRAAVESIFDTWQRGNFEMTAAMWAGLIENPAADNLILLDRAFASAGDPSEWPDFPTASPPLKQLLSERYTAFLSTSSRT